MAPAGNNKHCQDSMNETFYYTNVVPQDLDNNGNYWNRLEIWCRNLVNDSVVELQHILQRAVQAKEYQDVWITSGPLWLAVEEPQTEEAVHPTGPVAETLSTDSGDEESNSKKRRKVRPPRPATLRMTYPVIGPNKVSVPTHLYKVLVYLADCLYVLFQLR